MMKAEYTKVYEYLLDEFILVHIDGLSCNEKCARHTTILTNAVLTSLLGQLKRYSQNL